MPRRVADFARPIEAAETIREDLALHRHSGGGPHCIEEKGKSPRTWDGQLTLSARIHPALVPLSTTSRRMGAVL